MKKKSIFKLLTGFILFSLLVAFDQLTKNAATVYLKDKKPFVLINDVFEFNYLDGGNTGAAWGILSGQTMFFIVTTVIVCILICILLWKLEVEIGKNKNPNRKLVLLQLLFIMLISGAVGNLIDRVLNEYVVDFIYFKLINFPIFNVADCYVTVSIFLILITCMFFMSDEEFASIFYIKKNKKMRKIRNE